MRKFFLTYKANPKLAQLVREIPWGQNIVIIEKLNDDYQREYYLRMTVRNAWSRNILVHQIETKSFERFLADTKSHNFDTTLPVEMQECVEPVVNKTIQKLVHFREETENDEDSALIDEISRVLNRGIPDEALKELRRLERAKVKGTEYLRSLVGIYNRYRMGDLKTTERREQEYKPVELVCCEVLK